LVDDQNSQENNYDCTKNFDEIYLTT